MRSSIAGLIGIVLAGAAGAIASWSLVYVLGWSGIGAAIVAVLLAMGIAMGLFALGVRALKGIGWLE